MFFLNVHVFKCRTYTLENLSVLTGGVGDEQLEKVKFVVKTYENNCTKNTIHALTTTTAVISNLYQLVYVNFHRLK